jgi:hypothetical protein
VIDGRHFLLDTASLSILSYNPAHPARRVITLWNVSRALRPESASCRPIQITG